VKEEKINRNLTETKIEEKVTEMKGEKVIETEKKEKEEKTTFKNNGFLRKKLIINLTIKLIEKKLDLTDYMKEKELNGLLKTKINKEINRIDKVNSMNLMLKNKPEEVNKKNPNNPINNPTNNLTSKPINNPINNLENKIIEKKIEKEMKKELKIKKQLEELKMLNQLMLPEAILALKN